MRRSASTAPECGTSLIALLNPLAVMPTRTFKANRWLWCLASVVVFVGIGLLVQFDNQGLNAPLGLLALGWVWALLTGAKPLRLLPMSEPEALPSFGESCRVMSKRNSDWYIAPD